MDPNLPESPEESIIPKRVMMEKLKTRAKRMKSLSCESTQSPDVKEVLYGRSQRVQECLSFGERTSEPDRHLEHRRTGGREIVYAKGSFHHGCSQG